MKSKIFLITFTILIILIGFIPFSSANYDFTYNDTDYSLPDLPSDCLEFYYLEQYGARFYLRSFSINNPFSVGERRYISGTPDFSYHVYTLPGEDEPYEHKWIYDTKNSFDEGVSLSETHNFYLLPDAQGNYSVRNSNFDIYIKNDLVFQKDRKSVV